VEDATLAQRAYAVLERALEEAGELEPGHGRKAADRAIASRFGVSEASARNWRKGRQQHVSARVGERLVAEVADLSPRHAERLRMLHDLAHRLDRIDRIAERLAAELAVHMGEGTSWHIYSGPLVLAFAPSLRPAERADLAERAAALIVRASELGFDHRDVPALPELLRAMLHIWHHAGTFGLRARSVQRVLARAGRGYLNRIELALYLGDVCTMPGLFTGDLAEAERNARRARALLGEASDADEAASPVSRRDAATMLASVRAQILACHAPVAARPELAAFAQRARSEAPEIGWIDSVRCGALGYLAAVHGDAPEAAERFEAAVERSQAWLREIGIPFATTPHRALAACARRRAGGSARACLAQAHQALLEATELAARVDEIAARRAAEALERDLGDDLRADHHARRAAQRVAQHDLQAWDRLLVGGLAVTTSRAAHRLGPANTERA
jgi:hypothetical protein